MKRLDKKLFLITSLVTLLPMLLGLALWNHLPERMTTHWGIDGTADGSGSRTFAVLAPPLLCLAMHVFCVGATLLDTGNENQSHKALYIAYWAMPVTSIFAGCMIYGTAFELSLGMLQWINLLMGLLFAFIGNYLPKCRPNQTIGVRVSWTLSSAENWRKTHRFCGRLWLIGGMLMMLCAFLPGSAQMTALFIILPAIIIAPLVYSYLYHRREIKRH